MVLGDLNIILDKQDKIDGRSVSWRDDTILRDFLQSSGGIDLSTRGAAYTLSNWE